jgi:hypothetical protein
MSAVFCGLADAQPTALEAAVVQESAEAQPAPDPLQLEADRAVADLTALIASHQAAVVSANGKLVRGFKAVRAKRLGVGTYEVVFNRRVDKSAYSATLATPDISGAPSGWISLSPRLGNPQAVYVTTRYAGAAGGSGLPLDPAELLGQGYVDRFVMGSRSGGWANRWAKPWGRQRTTATRLETTKAGKSRPKVARRRRLSWPASD